MKLEDIFLTSELSDQIGIDIVNPVFESVSCTNDAVYDGNIRIDAG